MDNDKVLHVGLTVASIAMSGLWMVLSPVWTKFVNKPRYIKVRNQAKDEITSSTKSRVKNLLASPFVIPAVNVAYNVALIFVLFRYTTLTKSFVLQVSSSVGLIYINLMYMFIGWLDNLRERELDRVVTNLSLLTENSTGLIEVLRALMEGQTASMSLIDAMQKNQQAVDCILEAIADRAIARDENDSRRA